MLKAKASLIFFLISWIVVLNYQPITENGYVTLTYNALLAVISFYCINFALNSELRANKLLRHVIAAAELLRASLLRSGVSSSASQRYMKSG